MELTTQPWINVPSDPVAGAVTDAPPALVCGARRESFFRHDGRDLLRRAGLRPTRQRLLLSWLLFSNGGRHVTAEMLHTEAVETGMQMSLATVYNTLHQFTDAGLLRQIGVDGSKSFFDTNPTTHHHFFVDQEDRLLDVPEPGVVINKLPQPLPRYEMSRVDVIVHLRRKRD